MPKRPPTKSRTTTTNEALSYVQGLYTEYSEQLARYQALIGELFAVQARAEIVEKNLCVTRDHFAMAIQNCEEAVPPMWIKQLSYASFVGMRLADACITLLRQHKHMTYSEMLDALNVGMFRFRTNAPAREIHAALLRQQSVKRTSDGWVWTAPDEPAQPTEKSVLRLLPIPETINTEKK